MKSGQLIEYNQILFFKNYAVREAGRLLRIELFRIALVNLVTVVVLGILDNLCSMQDFLDANNC